VLAPAGRGAFVGEVLELTAGQQPALGGAPATSLQGQPLPEGLRMRFHTLVRRPRWGESPATEALFAIATTVFGPGWSAGV
jgi:hypothetical protein